VLLYDAEVRFTFLGGHGMYDLGIARQDVIGHTMAEIFPAEVWEPIKSHYFGVFEGISSTFELRFRDRIRQAHTMPIRDASGMIVAGMVVTYDITEQKQIEQSLREREERLRHLALHDPLTSLPNRTLFTNRLEQALVRARREGHGVGVLFIDLDRFKPVNDTLGHAAGDRLLEHRAGCHSSSETCH
jgi:PAS domain S-box-containing protein